MERQEDAANHGLVSHNLELLTLELKNSRFILSATASSVFVNNDPGGCRMDELQIPPVLLGIRGICWF